MKLSLSPAPIVDARAVSAAGKGVLDDIPVLLGRVPQSISLYAQIRNTLMYLHTYTIWSFWPRASAWALDTLLIYTACEHATIDCQDGAGYKTGRV
jgi:hypothetical protein